MPKNVRPDLMLQEDLRMKNKGTIAFYIGSLTIGGAERVICNLAEYFKSLGYHVYVVTKLRASTEYELSDGIERIIADITSEEETGSRIGNLIARVNKLKGIWRDIKPDIIVSFIGKNNVMALASARAFRIPVVVSVRSAPSREMASRGLRMACMTLFRQAAGIVLQTSEAVDFFPARLKRKAVILPNSINPKFIQDVLSGDDRVYEVRKDIIAVGRIDDNKNEKMLIDAFSPLASKYPDWNVRLYGDGERLNDLKEYTCKLGLEGRVIFHGNVDDIPVRMKEASIFALPSKVEGMPNALIEAMTLGLACISTDCPCGGPRDLIMDGTDGILIDVDDTDALTQNLERLMADEGLRKSLGTEAMKIIDKLHPDVVNERWREYLEGIIESR